MAGAISEKVNRPREIEGPIGAQLLDIITVGMYSDPRMALREYIQNAADSVDVADKRGILGRRRSVELTLDGKSRSITVQDYGTGVENSNVAETLVSLGCSSKEGTVQRGFRGIGRLGGLAYCDQVTFETRSRARERIGVVTWDGAAIRDILRSSSGSPRLAEVVQKVTKVRFRKPTDNDPPHFFRSIMQNVHPFHKDELMHVHSVRNYLAQTAPVSFNRQRFSFSRKIEKHLSSLSGYKTYDIRVNAEKVHRPYRDEFLVTGKLFDKVRDVELIDLYGIEDQVIGRGWYARTGLLGSLPPRQIARGIRVRQGNIEVGDEYFLADVFAERRFSTWHIGEIHLGLNIRPNARRDGFEQSPDFERFLEQVQLLGRHLSGLCRKSSEARSAISSTKGQLSSLEQRIAASLFLDAAHMESTVEAVDRSLAKVELAASRYELDDAVAKRVRSAKRMLASIRTNPRYVRESLDGRKLRHIGQKELLVRMCTDIMENHSADCSKQDLIYRLLAPYLK